MKGIILATTSKDKGNLHEYLSCNINRSIQQQTKYLLNTDLAVLPLHQLPQSKFTESVTNKDHSNVWTGPYRSI